MKKTILSIVAAASILSACGTKTIVVQETLPATLPPATTPSALDKETNFLNGLTADFPTQVTNLGKADTVELGYLMCQAIDEGTTLQDLLNMSYKLDVDAGFIGALVREAVENFCPANQWFIDAALNA
jgi:glycine cleavage system regulatory protein